MGRLASSPGRLAILGLLCFCRTPTAAAQTDDDAWSALRAKNPPGVEFTLRLLQSGEYRKGELIGAEIAFTGWSPTPAQRPPAERWQFAGFLLEPGPGCGSVASPCFFTANLPFDKTDPMLGFGERAGALAVILNNYLRPLGPGHYRVAMLARKLTVTARGATGTTYGYQEPAQFEVSNSVGIDVTPASGEWISRTISLSAATLKAPQSDSPAGYESRRRAAEQLQFLDVPEAWKASLNLLAAEENTLLRGLEASGNPSAVCELMQAAVPVPEQAVSSYYLFTLSRICTRAHFPAPPPPPVPVRRENPPEPSAEQRRYWQERQAFEQALLDKANGSLAAGLAGRLGDKKAMALQTLLERVQQIRVNGNGRPVPEWIPAVKAEFAKTYASAEPWRQRQLLSLYAVTLQSPDVIPVLESVLDGWKPGDYFEAAHEAVRLLYGLDPARAQARILAELRKEKTWLDSPDLDMLPANAARITDGELIAALAVAQQSGGWNVLLRMTALAKYASPRAEPRIRAIYESQQDSCQPELIAYFVRVDPAYADAVFHRQPWDMLAPPPACTLHYFARTPRVAMGPVLEKYMAAYLMHGNVPVKKTAALSLGQFGSPAARAPLWNAFRYFHGYWQGKQAELVQNGEGVHLEIELRSAIARGRHWLATDADLRAIESLCISERCRNETQWDIRAWQKPLRIELSTGPGGIRATVAQYYGIETVEALKERLGQFPKGTQFALAARGDGTSTPAAEIRKFAAARGLVIVSR